MALLIQDMLDRGYFRHRQPDLFVVKAQNVADFLFTQSDKEEWNDVDFPNVAPPFPNLWIEWRCPPFSRSGDKLVTFPCRPREAVHIISIEGRPETERLFWIASCVGQMLNKPAVPIDELRRMIGPPPASRWLCAAFFYTENNGAVDSIGCCFFGVSAEGRFVRFADNAKFGIVTRQPIAEHALNKLAAGVSVSGKEAVATRINVGLFVPFLALSFMHCRNTQVKKSEPTPYKLERRRQREGRQPILRYHMINVDALGRKTSYPAAESGLGSEDKALHICRGHFKHFGERGLFGKWKGMFWWPMHVRGSARSGLVISDYEIERHPAK